MVMTSSFARRVDGRLLLAAAIAGPVHAAGTAAPEPPLPQPPGRSAPAADAPLFRFGGQAYVHRWSHASQHEFTPAAQPDLSTWQDMVTVQVYDNVANPDELSLVANGVLVAYLKTGQVLRTTVARAMPGRPAEQFLVALLPADGVRELVFARFRLAPEGGQALVYSHRVYGAQPDEAASEWLRAHGAATEAAMKAWTDIPSVVALRALPQSP